MNQVVEAEVRSLQRADEQFGMVMSVGQAKAELQRLQEFVHSVMVPGVDFGVIPGTGNKPTLLKPGAEKLNEVYGYAPTVEITKSVEDWKAQPAFFAYTITCRLVRKRDGIVMAEGVGSCNSMEVKYRYRHEKNWHTSRPAGEAWEQKETAKGKVYWTRRALNEDTADLCNTILKMAKKRALVDATLSATRSSELFTQDIEDMQQAEVSTGAAVQEPTGNGEAAGQHAKADPAKSVCADCKADVAQAVKVYSENKFGRILCRKCQEKAGPPPLREE